MNRTPDRDDGLQNLVQRLDVTLDKPSGRIVAFISARPNEGTSTIARDYTLALAESSDHTVLLIDAGKIDRGFFDAYDADPAIAIADVAAAGKSLNEALFPMGAHAHFGRWASAGRGRSAANRLLKNDAFWSGVRDAFGTVVIDAPSLQESSDGIALAARADAAVIVVESEATRQPVIENLRDALNVADAKIAGIVMNKRRYYIPASVYKKM